MTGIMTALPGLSNAALASRGKPPHPNILLIVSDQHRRDTCGCYGSPVKRRDGESPTPHIDSLAATGVRFDSMYCPSPLCAPSRAAYMTGCYPHTTTALHHQMQGREAGVTRFPGVRGGIKGIGEYFREAGYRTATIGKVHVHGEMVDGWDLGFDKRELRFYTELPGHDYKELKGGDLKRRYREMAPYKDQFYRDIDSPRFAHAPEGLKVSDNDCNEHYLETLIQKDEEMADPMVTSESIRFMRECAGNGESFFIHVGLEKPHRPWSVPQKYLDRFDPETMPLPATVASWVGQGELPLVQKWCHSDLRGDEARRSIAAYYACVSAMDDCVGELAAACRALGIAENTIIIYTSDHGESLFEHGLIEKHNMLEGPVAVPFVISYPKRLPQDFSCNAPTSLLDLLPTLTELGFKGRTPGVEGVSLLQPVNGSEDKERIIFSEFYQAGNNCWPGQYTPVRMALNREFKYVYTHAALDQLYRRDPRRFDETVNLALDPVHEETLSRLKLAALVDWEMDEYPHLSATARVADGVLALSWEPWPAKACYDVYRGETADPAQSLRVARSLDSCVWTDRDVAPGQRLWYWVIGHAVMTESFRDRNGRQRLGDLPVKATIHPKKLPVVAGLQVTVEEQASASYEYVPLLGLNAFGRNWIYTGYKPAGAPDALSGRGPCLVLTHDELPAAVDISALIATPGPGPRPADTVGLVFNYDTMDRYYRVLLGTGGELLLQRRKGKRFEVLASALVEGANSFKPQSLRVASADGLVEVFLNSEPVLRFHDADPLPPGRAGYEADIGPMLYHVRDLIVRA